MSANYGEYNRDSVPEYVFTIPDTITNNNLNDEIEPPKYNTLNKKNYGEKKTPFYSNIVEPEQNERVQPVEPISTEWITVSTDQPSKITKTGNLTENQ